jgi:predicted RNA-binding Zn ribbon-like protein
METPTTMTDETLLLDLLNSTPVVDGVPQDLLGDAGAWLRERGGAGTDAEQTAILSVRAKLQAVVRGDQPPAALLPELDGVSYRPVAADHSLRWELSAPPARLLAARCVVAWDELHRRDPGRLRPCANDECALFLLDRSKANTARWCSMAVCGNRMKARRHYQRTRDHEPS